MPTRGSPGGLVVKASDVLNGYTILEDFKVVGAGLSSGLRRARWPQFFIKDFLTRPIPTITRRVVRRRRGELSALSHLRGASS